MTKLVGITLTRDADHQAETPGRTCLDTREGIFDDNRSTGLNPEQLCRHQERIWSGFPGQVLRMDHIAIDLHIEEMI